MSELFKPYRLAFMSPEGGETPGGDAAAADMVDAGAERPDESTPLTDEQVLARVESAMKLSFQKPEIKIGDEIFKPKSFFPGLMLTYQKGFEAAQTQNPFPELKSPEEFQKAWEAMAQRFLGNLEENGTAAEVAESAAVSGATGAVDAAAVVSGAVGNPQVAATVSDAAVAPENAATPEKAETTLADTLKEKKADILKVIDAHSEYKKHDWVAINAEMMKAINGPEGKGDDKSVMDFVKNMQEMLKVESDGKIGPITMEALKNYLNGVTDSVENAATDPAVDASSGQIQSAPTQGSAPAPDPSPAPSGDVVTGQPAQGAQVADQSKDAPVPAAKDAQVAQGAPVATEAAPEKIDPAKIKAEILKQRGENWTFTGDSTIGKIDRSKADDLLASKMAEQGYSQNMKVKIEAYNTRPNGYQQLYEVHITIGTYKYIGKTDARVNKDPNIAFAEAVKLIKTSDEEQAEVARKAAAKKAAEEAKKPDGPELAVTSDPAPSADGQNASPPAEADANANANVNKDAKAQNPEPTPGETVSAPEAIVQAEWTFEGNIGDQLEKANAKEELGKLLYQKGYRTIKNIVITANEVDENRTGTSGKEYVVKIKLDGQEFEGTAFDLATAFKIAAVTQIPEINAEGSPQPATASETTTKDSTERLNALLESENFKEATKGLPQEVSQVLAETLAEKGYDADTKIIISIDESQKKISIKIDDVDYTGIPYYYNPTQDSGTRARHVTNLKRNYFSSIKTQQDNREYRRQFDERATGIKQLKEGAEWHLQGNLSEQLSKGNAKDQLAQFLYEKGYRSLNDIIITADKKQVDDGQRSFDKYTVKIQLDGREFEGVSSSLNYAFSNTANKIPSV